MSTPRPAERVDASDASPVGPGLHPLRPDEVIVIRSSGAGDSSATGVAGDLVILYTVCAARRPIRVRTNLPRVAPFTVPCDGVVSRAQIYTHRGRRFRVDVEAPSSVSWRVLVTRRGE
ncbi:MAG: hypothetical protein JWN22_1836 [Nocardioides sp.]|nr:hypothetical protein [Nocardioides sp.]